MEWIIPNILYFFIIPMLLYYYYCRLFAIPYRWYWGLLYTALSLGLSHSETMFLIAGFVSVLLKIILLALFGFVLLKRKAAAFAFSALVISAHSIIMGLTQSITFWILSSLKAEAAIFMKYADSALYALAIILLIAVFRLIHKIISDGMAETHGFASLVLGVPVLFAALVERIVSDFIYGDTLIWDSTEGLVAPVVNNMELVILRLFAFAGLFLVLLAYQKLMTSIRNEQTIKLLEQQTQNQEIYVREAKSRYEQTLSFRHDIKNHLLVLRQLLREDKPADAHDYLANLEQMSGSLSFPVNTGNTVVDALLGSKLAVAAGQGIEVDCSVAIPRTSTVKDIDWCIILSNALDNAITASEAVVPKSRYIGISGKQKGNFFLLNIDNHCAQDTEMPTDGVGISNIKAVAQKYDGKAEIDIVDCIFKLSVLLVISQQ